MSDQMKTGDLGRCAVGTCRRNATVMLSQNHLRLALCDRHERAYTSLGYQRELPTPARRR